jgi:hypothetical protein
MWNFCTVCVMLLMKRLCSLLIFLCSYWPLNASELYDSLGRLHIDQTYQITTRQLARWNQVEWKLQQAIQKDFRYSEMAREYEIDTKLLLMLTVDTGGNIVDVTQLSHKDSSTTKVLNNHAFLQLQKIIAYTNLKTELKFRPFPGKYTQTFYLPFFADVVKEKSSRMFYRGWMYFPVEVPLPIDKKIICVIPPLPIVCIVKQRKENIPVCSRNRFFSKFRKHCLRY